MELKISYLYVFILFATLSFYGSNSVAKTVSYQCKSVHGVTFQQRPCERGTQTVLVYYDTSNFESGIQAHESVVDAINELTKANPTKSGTRAITVIGRDVNASDGKADGFREVDRSIKSSSY